MRKFGLPEEVVAAIRKIQALTAAAYALAAAMVAVQAASGPYGWIMAGISGVSAVVSATEFVMEMP
jgi:hypothetical protein